MSNIISFDYAIKYILKNKTGYSVVEDFISAVLTSSGYKPVKIKAPLERESNKEAITLKSSVADLAVEDEDGNGYIVEIDRLYSTHYLHKACFNTSRLIVDSIPEGDSFIKVKKVFHINLIFEDVDEFQGPLYHGKVLFHKVINKEEVLKLVDRDNHLYEQNVFPEYFVLVIPKFDESISYNRQIDDWLYLLKNEKIREDNVNPIIRKAYDLLSILKLTEEERVDYMKYCNDKNKAIDYIITAKKKGIAIGKEEGIAIGKEEGINEEKIRIAKKMLSENINLETISKCSGISIREVKKIKGDFEKN